VSPDKSNPDRNALWPAVVSIPIIFAVFVWQGTIGFSLWDEGFLWYGVQRVLKGEVPVRDFMAYDPGRYYWTAALLSVTGDDGIMSVRAAVALFQALGLFVGLLLIARSTPTANKAKILFLLLSAGVMVLWMFPRHKLFDISLSIFLIGVLSYLISNPSRERYLIAGFAVGLIAVFGRNHGMYGAVGSVVTIAWINSRNSSAVKVAKAFSLWTVGALLGFLPIVLMCMFVPGFAVAFMESVVFLFEQKATNLPLPIPWPWTVDISHALVGEALRGILVGLFFMGTLIFGGCSMLWVLRQRMRGLKVPPALVASAFLAIPYAHFAFSRADVGHLAQGIFPLLIGLLVILTGARPVVKWTFGTALLVASFWVMHVQHPGWYCYSTNQCVGVEVSGSRLMMDPGTAADIALLRALADEFAPDGRAFVVTPFWPGSYALLGRRSPMWELYALFPRSERFERREIERMAAAGPGFALVLDLPLDGREQLRFKNTHPLINQYILENFEPVERSTQSPYHIYKARKGNT
jgi:hypothetical protein